MNYLVILLDSLCLVPISASFIGILILFAYVIFMMSIYLIKISRIFIEKMESGFLVYKNIIPSVFIIISLFAITVMGIILSLLNPYDITTIINVLLFSCLSIDYILIDVLKSKYFNEYVVVLLLLLFIGAIFFNGLIQDAFNKYKNYEIILLFVIVYVLLTSSLSLCKNEIDVENQSLCNKKYFYGITKSLILLKELGLGSFIVILLFPTIGHFNWINSYNNIVESNFTQSVIVVTFSLIMLIIINGISKIWMLHLYCKSFKEIVKHIFHTYFTHRIILGLIILPIFLIVVDMALFSPNKIFKHQTNNYSWELDMYYKEHLYKFTNVSLKKNRIKINKNKNKYNKDKYSNSNKYLNELNNYKFKCNINKNKLILINFKPVKLLNNNGYITFYLDKFSKNGRYYFNNRNKILKNDVKINLILHHKH